MRSLTVDTADAEEKQVDWTFLVTLCFSSRTQQHRFSVTLGKNALNESDPAVEQTFRVEEVIIHAGYDNSEGNFNNDIGMNMSLGASVLGM